MKRPRPLLMVCFAVLLAALFLWVLWENSALVTTCYQAPSTKLPASFHNLKIAQVSDLHNATFGSSNQRLLTLLEDMQPDFIAITGDMVDSRRPNPEVAVAFAREAVKIAPVYYVPGNHESRIPEIYAGLTAELSALGVVILENKSVCLEKGTDSIAITGLTDPDFGISWPELPTDTYRIVLSHRPELLEQYAILDFDLVLTGHAHGGQIRLPWIGGLFAPHQGFFPTYDSGIYTSDNTSMVVSRGLGNSLFPLRIGNRPELVIVTLESV